MEIRLKRLELRNFMAIKKFVFEPNGKNATVKGANATGKTTLASGFRWLFFGKNVDDKTDFAIKGTDKSGQAVSNLDHTVRATLEIDGKPLELQKTYREKWTKKRGSATKTLTSHTTEHSIDGVPIQKKEWDSKMGAIINEDIFKLLTMPSFFSNMPWQRCRATLLEVCGDISDNDVIASDLTLSALPAILSDRSLEDQKKVIAAKKKKVNDRLKEIPARIDELLRTLPSESANRKVIKAYIKNIDKKIQAAKDDTVLSGLRKDLAEAQVKLAEAKAKTAQVILEANAGVDAKVFEAQAEIRKLKSQIDAIGDRVEGCEDKITRNNKSIAELKATHATVTARKQTYDEICPTCNQPLPSDQIEAAKAQFNENQATELTSIQADARKLKAGNETLQETVDADEKKIKSLGLEIDGFNAEIVNAEKGRVETTPTDHTLLKTEITRLQVDIEEKPTTDTTALETERREGQTKLAVLDSVQGTKKRIKELDDEEKRLAGEYEELEGQIFLMEKFTVAKCNLLEGQINSKFELVKWKLFDIQVNEGVKECCIPTLNGSTDLSNSERINVGLDIIRTLSNYYDIHCPIWIDNCESITHPLEIPSQTIKLVVSEDHPKMEIIYE